MKEFPFDLIQIMIFMIMIQILIYSILTWVSQSLELTPVAAPRFSMRMSSLAMGMNCPFILARMLEDNSIKEC